MKCICVRNWIGPSAGGYGTSAEKLLLALNRRADIITRLVPLAGGWELVHPEVQKLADVQAEPDVVIHYGGPGGPDGYKGMVAYTMTEGTDLPEEWAVALNNARLVLVPAGWVKTVFEVGGVTSSVEVLPFGIEQGPPASARAKPNPFTFLAIDKGPALVYEAFKREFTQDEPVRLILKARSPFPAEWSADPRVRTISEYYSETQMRALYLQASCFVHLPEGAGWAIPVSDAVGLGVAVIAPLHSGTREYLHESYVVPVGAYPVVATHHMRGFKWMFRVEDVAWSMRQAFSMGDRLFTLAEKAQHFTRHLTWDRSAQTLIDILVKHGLL